ncbi:unnamed protein product [Aphanomyces euteiches]
MLSRVALRAARLSAFKPATAAFHTGAIRQKEEKQGEVAAAPAASADGFLQRYGLDDPLIAFPIAAAISIPAISNGWYELGAETQLACCFALFCTSAYKFGGEAIGSYFETRANAILAEQNAVEDANLELAKETLKAHEAILTIKKDIDTLGQAHEEALALMCQVQNAKLRHKTRETFVKNLEAIYQLEQSYNQELQEAMVASATAAVRKTMASGKKEIKAEAFKLALDILSEKEVDESKPDPVAAAFGKELRTFAEHLEAQQGTVVKLTEAEQKELEAGLDAFFKKIEVHADDLKAPTEVKVELL